LASGAEALVVCCGAMGLDQIRTETTRLASERWWSEIRAVRDGRVALVDGRRGLAVPGPGLVDAFEWMVGWLNGRPELMPEGFAWEAL